MPEIFIMKAVLNSFVFLSAVIFLANTMELKCKKITAIILMFLITYIPSVILNVVFVGINSENMYVNILRFIQTVVDMIIVMKLFGRVTWKDCIKKIAIIYLVSFVIEALALLYFMLVVDNTGYESSSPYDNNSSITLLALAVEGLISLIVVMPYLLLRKKIRGKIKYQILSILVIIPLFNIILITLLYINNYESAREITPIYSACCLIVSFIVDITVYEIIINIEKYYEQEKQFKFLKEKEKMIYDYYKLAISNKEELRKMRHDMRNELQIAYSLMEDEQGIYKAKDILDQMQDNLEKNRKIEYCDNAILNALLGIKVSQAQEQQIDFEVQIEKNMSIMLEDIDICNIFSNLIDNSIEGCSNLEEKKIELEIKEQMGFIVIKIENTYQGELLKNKRNEILTTKEDSRNHGYGLKIVKSIVDKYQGQIEIENADNHFKVIILLPQEKKERRKSEL